MMSIALYSQERTQNSLNSGKLSLVMKRKRDNSFARKLKLRKLTLFALTPTVAQLILTEIVVTGTMAT